MPRFVVLDPWFMVHLKGDARGVEVEARDYEQAAVLACSGDAMVTTDSRQSESHINTEHAKVLTVHVYGKYDRVLVVRLDV